ncbi:MAG: dienelactone hydrolase family protein, partial [Phycisphaerae bacterium]|nr:dienelactone hydrolase family protein [Phycisphaerae bacterium]
SPWDWLERARTFHLDAIAGSTRRGDDFGNVTAMPESGVFGMNRLNHCPPIFRSYYRYSDTRLREVALLWCVNFHDSSIWWGETGQTRCGGTRYNNMARENKAYRDDPEFMWRSDTSVSFCTKGYDSFLLAYEETGDPRMATALYWQVEYARHDLHANTGECRNIGDVADFMNLYHFTGVPMYRDEAIRLFHELREKLSPGHLFSQGGQTIVADPPFIDDDQHGSLSPFAKPYIIGYALAGLPALAAECPDETELVPVIRAVARFLAESQDPVGGWRYPHPRSSHSSVAQGIEHAAQITRAAVLLEQRGEPIGDLLDALECTLQSRILVWRKTGSFFSGLGGWEAAGGLLKDGKTLYDLYARPTDRDRQRDYTEGPISIGGAPPEGVVYFPEVLAFYLAHRPAERLLHPNPQLAAVLERLEPTSQGFPELEPAAEYLPYGLAEQLPTFRDVRIERLTFPLRFRPEQGADFAHWRRTARAALFECLQTPPPRADFEPVVIGREDRGSYEARKIVFNVSTDCRILAYLLVPHGHGPFPAIVALHDHGAEFSIGKEKVIRPFGVTPQVAKIAEQWVDRYYGGRWYGDELARRGYVVFALDALFWGERGCKEGVEFERQQALAANLLQMGMTWSGVITWDDIRSAEFVASLPEVDPMRIGAVGLSMGSHRTWMLAAASDRIATGAAICWLGTTESLMAPGNNQTKGYSAYSMLVPNLRNLLDYPDTASIACPKPMIFFNGADDPLFPVQGVYDAYAILRAVWESQDCSDRLVTKIWPTGHTFNRAMQDEVFAWFDRYLP